MKEPKSECVSGSCGCDVHLPIHGHSLISASRSPFFFVFCFLNSRFSFTPKYVEISNVVECCDEYLYLLLLSDLNAVWCVLSCSRTDLLSVFLMWMTPAEDSRGRE